MIHLHSTKKYRGSKQISDHLASKRSKTKSGKPGSQLSLHLSNTRFHRDTNQNFHLALKIYHLTQQLPSLLKAQVRKHLVHASPNSHSWQGKKCPTEVTTELDSERYTWTSQQKSPHDSSQKSHITTLRSFLHSVTFTMIIYIT